MHSLVRSPQPGENPLLLACLPSIAGMQLTARYHPLTLAWVPSCIAG